MGQRKKNKIIYFHFIKEFNPQLGPDVAASSLLMHVTFREKVCYANY